MRYREFMTKVTEGRDAELFHITSLESAIEILRTDTFHNHLHMTRTLDHPFGFSDPVMFVLSQERLSHRYKLQPRFGDIEQGWGSSVTRPRENEEYIDQTITPAHSVIKGIFIHPGFLYADEYKKQAKKVQRLAKTRDIPVVMQNWSDSTNRDDRTLPMRPKHRTILKTIE